MRDFERLQDVVEYRVSPGQLRLAFLGVLAAVCAIFAVGVSVGKRIEPTHAGISIDPLATLNQGATTEEEEEEAEAEAEATELTYHNELTSHEDTNEASADEAEETAAAASASADEPDQIEDEPAVPDEPSPGESSIYTLQVASYETREEASDFANDLRSRGHSVFLVRTSTSERGTWYRVRVGPFHSRREATTYQSRFERLERLPTFLVRRRR